LTPDFDALCVFRLCLVRAYHDEPLAVEGAPTPAQRWRIAAHRMGRKGSFAVPLIESFPGEFPRHDHGST
jgi:hypothetical protein